MRLLSIFRRATKDTASLTMAGQRLSVNLSGSDPALIERHMMRNARIRQKIAELDPGKDADRIRELESELRLREAALGVKGR
ncbi:MAG: hypothetical protein WCF16_02185 [Alphaproteobacteria bacterium]